jgi:hypothetical protein
MGTPPDVTTEPFHVAFTRLKAASGKSFRTLSSELADEGRRLSPSYLTDLANGVERPAPSAMASIASVLGKDRTYFAEYRLAQLRALLDDGGESGLDGALSAASLLPSVLQSRALEVDPADVVRGAPAGAGPAWRSRSKAAA